MKLGICLPLWPADRAAATARGGAARFESLGLGPAALEVSHSTCPAILQTIDVLAAEVKPRLG